MSQDGATSWGVGRGQRAAGPRSPDEGTAFPKEEGGVLVVVGGGGEGTPGSGLNRPAELCCVKQVGFAET